MLELKFAIYHRAVSLSSQASSLDVCGIGWRIIDQTRLSSSTPCTPTVFLTQQSYVGAHNDVRAEGKGGRVQRLHKRFKFENVLTVVPLLF